MKKRINKVIVRNLLLLLFFILYLVFFKVTGIGIPCVFREITGFKCPGCGITHLFLALLRFDFKEAFLCNPLVFILLPFFIFYFIYLDYAYIVDKKDNLVTKIPKAFWIILLLITILFGILRNIL